MLAAGVQLRVGLEHTYGAGPCTSAHEEFDHCFQQGFPWSANTTMGVVKRDLQYFDFLQGGAQQIAAGVFPWDLSTNRTNYGVEAFEGQLHSAMCGDNGSSEDEGVAMVWLWQAGVLSPATAAGIHAVENWLAVLRKYSAARNGTGGVDLCKT